MLSFGTIIATLSGGCCLTEWPARPPCSLSHCNSPTRFANVSPWHRIVGRIYVCRVVVAARVGIWIEYIKYAHYSMAPLRLLIATIGFGTLWLLTTSMGFWMAKHRNIAAHRRRMRQSYSVAVVFFEVRFVSQLTWLTKLWDRPFLR